MEEVLEALLPAEVTKQTSFETVGQIAHLNLRSDCLPYKDIIGQVILDKNPRIATVVNKLDQIDHSFRFFQMEILAGVPNTLVKLVCLTKKLLMGTIEREWLLF